MYVNLQLVSPDAVQSACQPRILFPAQQLEQGARDSPIRALQKAGNAKALVVPHVRVTHNLVGLQCTCCSPQHRWHMFCTEHACLNHRRWLR